MNKPIIKIAVLGSTRGTSLQKILDLVELKILSAKIELVISNKKDAYILKRAKNYEISAVYLSTKNKTREQYDREITAELEKKQIDLILLIGYMRILSSEFVQKWQGKIINVHPSLLPMFAGGMDIDVHQKVIDSGIQETGCTIHFVDEGVDTGEIIVQKKCKVLPFDTAKILKARVQNLEGDAFVEAIEEFAKNHNFLYNSYAKRQIPEKYRREKMAGTALLSVYNKKGIVDFARRLVVLGWKIVASGGTAKILQENGIPVQDVANFVGGGAILGHRVVTLSREIHSALLARDTEEDNAELACLGVPRIDLVCVDLYPLYQAIVENGELNSVLEKTDVGGPALLRSASKGRRIVVCDSEDREQVLSWLALDMPNKEENISYLSAKAERIVAEYCLQSAGYHSDNAIIGLVGDKISDCKYGENAWQGRAAFYKTDSEDVLGLDKFKQVLGSSLSYNNWCDVDRMLQIITHIVAVFSLNRGTVPYIAVAVKHGNACGVAIGENPIEVLQKAIDGDKRAIFGGSLITNFSIGDTEVVTILHYGMTEKKRRILDCIVAPEVSFEAKEKLKRRQGKCRVLVNADLIKMAHINLDKNPRFRYVRGGFLYQDNYAFILNLNDSELEKNKPATIEIEDDMLLAWAVGSTSNSNTITLVKDKMLIGNGVGQQDRVGACKLAISRAESQRHNIASSVAYSDSFFPFLDGPETLFEKGVLAILTSSGSVCDLAVKKYCEEKEIVLYMIPDQKGRGFFGH